MLTVEDEHVSGRVAVKEKDDEVMEPQSQSTSSSYLVRVWRETGEGAEVRFYLRNLKTGEERYLGDPGQIAELLTGGLRVDRAPRPRQRETA